MIKQLWMNQRDGVISVLVLVAIFLLTLIFILGPVISQKERYRVELTRDARILQQLRALDNARDDLSSRFQEYQDRDLQSWVYSHTGADTVTLDIQRRVSAELANADAQVRTLSPLPMKLEKGYLTVGVQVDFSASIPALMQVLRALEQGKPLLLMGNMSIRPIQIRVRRDEVAQQLVSVQMTVQTFLVPASNEGEVK